MHTPLSTPLFRKALLVLLCLPAVAGAAQGVQGMQETGIKATVPNFSLPVKAKLETLGVNSFKATLKGPGNSGASSQRVEIHFDVDGKPDGTQGCRWKYEITAGGGAVVSQEFAPQGTRIATRNLAVTHDLMPGNYAFSAVALDMPNNTCYGRTAPGNFNVPYPAGYVR